MSRANNVWTRQQVANGILAGDNLIILDGALLKVPQVWLERHPGGRLAILHFVGRDATDEVGAFHSNEALKKMKAYIVGRVEMHPEDGWEPFLPPVMSGWLFMNGKWTRTSKPIELEETDKTTEVFLQHLPPSLQTDERPTLETIRATAGSLSPSSQFKQSLAYRQLHQQVKDAGLYSTPYLGGYGREIIRYLIFAACCIITYRADWKLVSAVFLGILWQQLAFTAHDLGHNGVTHDWATDRIIGAFIGDLFGGLSIGWWVDVRPLLLTAYKVLMTISRTTTFITVCPNVHSIMTIFLPFASCHKPPLSRSRHPAYSLLRHLTPLLQISLVLLLLAHHGL
jgi:delta8-fatty-acid desaturase